MYGRERLGRLSWRFLNDEAGYGALTDLMSHAIDMALHLSGSIACVVATKNIFVKERPLPTSGKGTHYSLGGSDDPTGAVTNED
jgi:predicted dehydrogenase